MYINGEDVERDMEQAVMWLRKAASQDPENTNNPRERLDPILMARRHLAQLYSEGKEGARTRPLEHSALSSRMHPRLLAFKSTLLLYYTCQGPS
jgi:hypothetical protein